MESYSINDIVSKKNMSVSEFVQHKLKEYQTVHGSFKVLDSGGLNYDLYEFADGYVLKVEASYGVISFEKV